MFIQCPRKNIWTKKVVGIHTWLPLQHKSDSVSHWKYHVFSSSWPFNDLREKYENLDFILDRINYKEYEWLIRANLKVINLLNGLQTVYKVYVLPLQVG